MAMKLLPAAVNPVDASPAFDVSTSLVPLTQRGITARAGQISLVPSADDFTWSSATRRGEAKRIDATVVEDPQSDETGRGEYVSGWAWASSFERTAIDHYLSYAAAPAVWRGWLINLYA
jgi:hypothetical protein